MLRESKRRGNRRKCHPLRTGPTMRAISRAGNYLLLLNGIPSETISRLHRALAVDAYDQVNNVTRKRVYSTRLRRCAP